MKITIQQKLRDIIAKYSKDKIFDILIPPNVDWGDYSTNLAFRIIGNPMVNAENLKSIFAVDEELKILCGEISVVGSGFVNFKLSANVLNDNLGIIIKSGDKYGDLEIGKDPSIGSGQEINLEFVSANPTGPPTVGNARAASYGDTLGNILRKAGYQVIKEYYLNDIGVQVNKLGLSVAKRYLQLQDKDVEFEEDLYQGEYIKDIAKEFESEIKSKKLGDMELLADFCRDRAVEMMTEKAKQIMNKMGVEFDVWFKESELYKSGEVAEALERLKKEDVVEEKDGATWFKYGEDKEAVLIKSDGNKTYLMGDIAYSLNKLEKRGFDKAINIWGTDHHGDVPRLLGAIKILGHEGKLEIILHQLVTLKSKDEKLKISKRAGNLVLLEDLIKDVGKDATRFFFLSKDLNTHMEFDIDLAKEQSKKNPVFYIQYAFARLNSIFVKLKIETEKLKFEVESLKLLKEKEEIQLMRTMAKFPDVLENIVHSRQVHHLATYAHELAGQFHQFYEKHRVVQDNLELQNARTVLAQGVYIVLKNCLNLMGLSTPFKM